VREQEQIHSQKLGKEIVAETHRGSKRVPYYGAQADSGRAQDTQALTQVSSGCDQTVIRLCSGMLRPCSGMLTFCSG